MSIKQRTIKILSNLYFLMSSYTLTFDPLTSKPIGAIYTLRCNSVQRLMFIKERVFKILNGKYILMSSLTFGPQNLLLTTLYLLTSKSIELIYYLGYNSVLSLKSVEQRVLKILSGQNIPISSVNRP
jgi:hypothetical protein